MTDEPSPSTSPAPPDPGGLQFDKAEPAQPEATAAVCEACQKPLQEFYFLLHARKICAACQAGLKLALESGSAPARFFRALLFGIGAGAVGSAIYFAVLKATGYEIGLVAIV